MGMDGLDVGLKPSAESSSVDGGVRAPHDDIALRAATDVDMDFLRDVFSSTRIQEFLSAGLPVEQIESLLASQFLTQHEYYRRHYPHGRFDIIMQGGRSVGRLYHDWSGDVVRVIDIALLPAYRGAGIGTRLMRAIVARAASKRMPIQLYVEFSNPVRTLYRTLGFVPTGENGIYELMRRDVMPFDDEEAQASIKGLNSHVQ
ncbi:GNAT family N-acetyltransferase [Dyella sp.]|uniref:GNAT family N-acetyltransferase n=1 Tax=Dyella sp. TaxID=1869338 RepID=UPI002D79EB97|nr:GNAT family N-acetyltransferase [Dyella sp.]HET7333015.1 GNAT family N-acetyltransferase [Dyella sp.]